MRRGGEERKRGGSEQRGRRGCEEGGEKEKGGESTSPCYRNKREVYTCT